MIVQLDIHESLVKKVREGQRDVDPPRRDRRAASSPGRVRSVSSVPSTSNQWMNPDLKVYPTEIEIEEELERPEARHERAGRDPGRGSPGRPPACRCRRSTRAAARTYAYVDRGGAPEVVPVELGLNNDRAVVVKSGLNEGDRVYLSLPPGAPRRCRRRGARPRRPAEDEPAARRRAALRPGAGATGAGPTARPPGGRRPGRRPAGDGARRRRATAGHRPQATRRPRRRARRIPDAMAHGCPDRPARRASRSST